jgi:two-component system cell cycle response regulator
MALTDPLTGFYNQRYLMRHLTGLMSTNIANGVAVMMIDVDHFKQVNDRWGHPVGDRALKAVADTLRGRIRLFDSIARYGGEEFAVVMPGTGLQEATSVAERLRISIEELRFAPEPGVNHALTVSIGVAAVDAGDWTPQRLLRDADAALYEAKRSGRNRVEMSLAA